MPYASDNKVSQSPIEGGIEITQEQYAEAIEAMQEGQRIVVTGGDLLFKSNDKRKVYSTTDGSPLEVFEGDETPDGYTDQTKPGEHYEWDGSAWVEDEQAALEAWRETASCTRRQGRLALLGAGELDNVESALDAIEDDVERMAARIEYEADTWERSNAFLQQMWASLGGTPEALDDLFVLAATK